MICSVHADRIRKTAQNAALINTRQMSDILDTRDSVSACKNQTQMLNTMNKGLGETQTLRALAVVRCGHLPPARCKHANTQTDRTDNNTVRRS